MNQALPKTETGNNAHAGESVAAEANRRQFEATVPGHTVWVGASAGSGKTKVLAERVLRLLLPDGAHPAADPAKVLCITFTKAAASEVLERIMRYLRRWAIAPQPALEAELAKLLGRAAEDAQIAAARALFARVLEVPGGMKIMTIHAFCQSVLARFPMEAGLPAGFEVMEENDASALMRRARHEIISRLQMPEAEGSALKAAFDYLSANKNVSDLEKLMGSLASERARLARLRARYRDVEGICAAVYGFQNISMADTRDGLISAFMQAMPEDALRAILPLFDEGTKNLEIHDGLAKVLAAPQGTRADLFDTYKDAFIGSKNNVRPIYSKAKADANASAVFAAEGERMLAFLEKLSAYESVYATASLLRFSYAALDAYEAEKRRCNRLDFEDLIDRTKNLLGAGGVHWVQYKLDGGIDHILVDEAQDTNPDQWDIVTALYDEFYDGASAREPLARTTFVVGDEKQSIFSFQRADPAVFGAMRERLKDRAQTGGQATPYVDVPMRISFRSSPSVLRVVDAVFESDAMREGVVRDNAERISHQAFKSGKAGHVEIWPQFEKAKPEEKQGWLLPAPATTADDPVSLMAQKVASTIAALLREGRLESQDRPVRAGDIMILLNRRKPLADAILKALRRENVPVGGIDRMVVSRQLAVLDVLSALEFVLQPDDDLNLAALLKSPLLGLGDDGLFMLCRPQRSSLWAVLRQHEAYGAAGAWLSGLLELGGQKPGVAALLHHVLYSPCPSDGHSGLRAIMARLGRDARDPLQELLARADRHDMSDNRGLQGFVQDMRADLSEIKRQMKEDGNRVRMMTVHGSKGLEAPIVFMPDTIRTAAAARKIESILWPERGERVDVPLWAPNANAKPYIYRQRAELAKKRADEEYKRLLYVALTRAGERLYIGGAEKSLKSFIDKTGSWYYRCKQAFEEGTLANVQTAADGTMFVCNRQTDAPEPDSHKQADTAGPSTLPAWAFAPAPAPAMPPRPLAPSKPEGEEPAAISPLFGDTAYRYKRGRVIHTLFQFLPELPVPQRRVRAKAWLAQPSHGLDTATQDEILASVFAVLENPVFADIFTCEARAEVPLTGLLGANSVVSGQIDRLLVRAHEILIIDYKTNRPAPKAIADVPEAYRRQMRTYRALLAALWPERPVRCALLWTDGPDLMDITDIL